MILAFDTCSDEVTAAVFDGEEMIACRSGGEKGNSKGLMELVDLLLDDAKGTPSDLSAIVLTSGPGSFTGVRTGIAAALGIRAGVGCSIFSCTLFEALSEAVPANVRIAGALVRAGRREAAIKMLSSGNVDVGGAAHEIVRFGDLADYAATNGIETYVAHARLAKALAEEGIQGVVSVDDVAVLAWRFLSSRGFPEGSKGSPTPLYTREFRLGGA